MLQDETVDHYDRFSFAEPAARLIAENMPHLLADFISEFEVQSLDQGPLLFGRLKMRTLDGEPIFYLMFKQVERGALVSSDDLAAILADVTGQTHPVVSRRSH